MKTLGLSRVIPSCKAVTKKKLDVDSFTWHYDEPNINQIKDSKYSKILADHDAGNLMFRDKKTLYEQKIDSEDKVSWYKKKGYQYAVQVPMTTNQVLSKKYKNRA